MKSYITFGVVTRPSVVLPSPTLLESAISSLTREFRSRRLIQEGVRSMYPEKKEVQTETRCAEDARDTKSTKTRINAHSVFMYKGHLKLNID
jgi:hypothetical protein